ncbi:MAG TPA: pyridoxamine 5'-phosphate oxidase, partial [Acidimicrobiales bacterium]
GLRSAEVDPDPIAQFHRWLADATAAGIPDPGAMILATADGEGIPSARTVLLKHVDHRGFVFYTNRTSRKGRDLTENPHAALVFPWYAVRRQVVVSGDAEEVDAAEADAYFASRPRGSQLGAWASRQSAVVPGRGTIDQWFAEAQERFAPGPVPRPPFWGGWRVVPVAIELWQGRSDRLHDRLRYRRDPPDGTWILERLSP